MKRILLTLVLLITISFATQPAFAQQGDAAYPLGLFHKALQVANSDKSLANRTVACLVDFSRPSYERRLWIVDLKTGKCLYNTWVSHGKGTGRSAVAKTFSNRLGSECSSLGRFLPKEVFDGKHGLSLRLTGLDKGVNDRAEERGIIFHGADYVNEYNAMVHKRQGNSQGCFAVPQNEIKRVIDLLKGNAAFVLASLENESRVEEIGPLTQLSPELDAEPTAAVDQVLTGR